MFEGKCWDRNLSRDGGALPRLTGKQDVPWIYLNYPVQSAVMDGNNYIDLETGQQLLDSSGIPQPGAGRWTFKPPSTEPSRRRISIHFDLWSRHVPTQATRGTDSPGE